MPGRIHVSVLGLMDVPSSQTSMVTIKVAIGKTEYQTLDKGDFSFPLTSLRDTLVVTVFDAKGNEISCTDIATKSVVEKGFWDDLFPLKGGGLVHLKLCFNLNEVERKRIHEMRESITRKRKGDLVKTSLKPANISAEAGNLAVDFSDSIAPDPIHDYEMSVSSFTPGEGNQDGQSNEVAPHSTRPLNGTYGSVAKSKFQLYKEPYIHLMEANHRRIGEKVRYQMPLGVEPLEEVFNLHPKYVNSPIHNYSHDRKSFSSTLGEDVPCSSEPDSARFRSSNIKKLISVFETSLTEGNNDPMLNSKLNMGVEDSLIRSSLEIAATRRQKETERKQSFIKSLREATLQRPEAAYLASSCATRKGDHDSKQHLVSDGRRTPPHAETSTAWETSDWAISSKRNGMLHQHPAGTLQLIEEINDGLVQKEVVRNNEAVLSDFLSTTRIEKAGISNPALLDGNGANEACGIYQVKGTDLGTTSEDPDEHTAHVSANRSPGQKRFGGRYAPFGNIESWMFHDISRHFCITVVPKNIMNLIDPCGTMKEEAGCLPNKEDMGDDIHSETGVAHRISDDSWEPKGCTSMNSANSGLFQQTLRIAIIMACGTIFLSITQLRSR